MLSTTFDPLLFPDDIPSEVSLSDYILFSLPAFDPISLTPPTDSKSLTHTAANQTMVTSDLPDGDTIEVVVVLPPAHSAPSLASIVNPQSKDASPQRTPLGFTGIGVRKNTPQPDGTEDAAEVNIGTVSNSDTKPSSDSDSGSDPDSNSDSDSTLDSKSGTAFDSASDPDSSPDSNSDSDSDSSSSSDSNSIAPDIPYAETEPIAQTILHNPLTPSTLRPTSISSSASSVGVSDRNVVNHGTSRSERVNALTSLSTKLMALAKTPQLDNIHPAKDANEESTTRARLQATSAPLSTAQIPSGPSSARKNSSPSVSIPPGMPAAFLSLPRVLHSTAPQQASQNDSPSIKAESSPVPSSSIADLSTQLKILNSQVQQETTTLQTHNDSLDTISPRLNTLKSTCDILNQSKKSLLQERRALTRKINLKKAELDETLKKARQLGNEEAETMEDRDKSQYRLNVLIDERRGLCQIFRRTTYEEAIAAKFPEKGVRELARGIGWRPPVSVFSLLDGDDDSDLDLFEPSQMSSSEQDDAASVSDKNTEWLGIANAFIDNDNNLGFHDLKGLQQGIEGLDRRIKQEDGSESSATPSGINPLTSPRTKIKSERTASRSCSASPYTGKDADDKEDETRRNNTRKDAGASQSDGAA